MLLGTAPRRGERELGTTTSASLAFSCPQGTLCTTPAWSESRCHGVSGFIKHLPSVPSFLSHSLSRRCVLGPPPDPPLAFNSCCPYQLPEEAVSGLRSGASTGGQAGPGTRNVREQAGPRSQSPGRSAPRNSTPSAAPAGCSPHSTRQGSLSPPLRSVCFFALRLILSFCRQTSTFTSGGGRGWTEADPFSHSPGLGRGKHEPCGSDSVEGSHSHSVERALVPLHTVHVATPPAHLRAREGPQ